MIPIGSILDAIKAKLSAATWTPQSGPAEPAFGEVHLFDGTDLVAAFSELIISKSRVALVIYSGANWEPMGSAATRRMPSVSIVASDRQIGKKREAIFGSATTPGALKLIEIAAVAVTGRLLDSPPCDCRPTSEDTVAMEDLRNKQPGRYGAILDLSLSGGILEVPDQDTAAA